MVVYSHEAECQAEKVGHYLQCQGHSEDLCNQNKTIKIFYYIFQTAGPFATRLGVVVRHYKPECPAEKLHYCGQGQGYSDG